MNSPTTSHTKDEAVERDADGLDIIEALIADATAAEGVCNVHEGGGYYAERVIRRAIEQGNLKVVGPANHPAALRSTAPASEQEAMCKTCAQWFPLSKAQSHDCPGLAPTPADQGVVERLLARVTGDNLGDPDDDLINPDGPEAAAYIASLQAKITALVEGHETAWREGWGLCKESLTEDEAACLTHDVEEDAWADSVTRALLTQHKDGGQ